MASTPMVRTRGSGHVFRLGVRDGCSHHTTTDRFREAVGDPAEGHRALHQGPGCHPAGAVRDRQDRYLLRRCGTLQTGPFFTERGRELRASPFTPPLPGILNNIDYTLADCQGLVLAPTRELAQQIEKVMRALGDYLQVKCHACVGGTSVREDARILGAGVHVIVGTPGRVYDMLRRRCLRADNIKVPHWGGGEAAQPRGLPG